jgi:hypothetical protein
MMTLGLSDSVSSLAKLIVALLFLLCIALVSYIIYKIFKDKYPRPYTLGHSEPYDDFMPKYLADLLNTISSCAKNELKLVPQSIVSACKQLISEDSVKENQKLIGKIDIMNTFVDEADCTPDNMPALYMYFIYKEAIFGQESHNELVLYKRFFDENDYAAGIDAALGAKRMEVRDKIKPDIQKLHDFFQNIMKLSDSPSPIPANRASKYDALTLKLNVLASYRNEIFKAFDYRKSGGPGNMKLIVLLMRDYMSYTVEVLSSVWTTWLTDIIKTGDEWATTASGPSVTNFVNSLPAKIGGVETFLPGTIIPPYTKPGDTVEHLGFLKGLLEIPKFFMTLMNVAKAIATSITNPVKVFRIIIGLIIGTIIAVLFTVIISLSFLFYIPATIWVVFRKIYQTIWLIFQWFWVLIFYFILWLIDFATGGAILPLFRCENLPDSWYKQPGFFEGNKNKRGKIFCNRTCFSRYAPNADSGYCHKLQSRQPAFCPQQILFQCFDKLLNGDTGIVRISPMLYDFKPDVEFFALPLIEQQKVIAETLTKKYKHLKKCYTATTDYRKAQDLKFVIDFNNRKKHDAKNDIYVESSKAICDYLYFLKSSDDESHKKLVEDNKTLIDQMSLLCKETYCKATYFKKKQLDLTTFTKKDVWDINPSSHAEFSFCKEDDNEAELRKQLQAIEDNSAVNIFSKTVLGLLAIIIMIIIFIMIMVYTFDKNELYIDVFLTAIKKAWGESSLNKGLKAASKTIADKTGKLKESLKPKAFR